MKNFFKTYDAPLYLILYVALIWIGMNLLNVANDWVVGLGVVSLLSAGYVAFFKFIPSIFNKLTENKNE